MSNVFRLGSSIADLVSSPQFDAYTKVVISVTDDISYSAGTDSGKTLSLSCPWGTQEMAEDILTSIRGYQYQPYTAKGAILDPSAELGDGVSIRGVYGGIYSQSIKFGGICASDISAPEEEEIDHEYPYVPKQERVVNRQLKGLSKSYAELKIAADEISSTVKTQGDQINGIDEQVSTLRTDTEGIHATVTAQGEKLGTLTAELNVEKENISAKVSKYGGSSSSFGWELDSVSWKLTSNETEVLIADKNGLDIKGKITATGGTIGGFTINDSSLSSNKQVWSGEIADKGVYIGPEGIRLGKNFKVDNQGNLEAASGTFTGEVSASSIKYGKEGDKDYGTLSGSAISSSSVTTSQLSKGVNTSLGYANASNDIFANGATAEHLYGKKVQATTTFQFGQYTASIGGLSVIDASGKLQTFNYLKMDKL